MEASNRSRLLLLAGVVVALAAALGVRLYVLQVLRADSFRARARHQHERQVVVQPSRGLILDRHGHELAVSLETESLFVHPHRVADPASTARLLAPVLGTSESTLRQELRSDRPFVYLRRFLEPAEVAEIRRLPLDIGPGRPLGFLPESKRYYPRGELGVHVVGFANIDGEGLEGVEKEFDGDLRGDPDVYLITQDARSGPVQWRVEGRGKQPHDLVLSLDIVLQHVVERELDRAMQESGAHAGSAVLLDPATGEILALANRPAADPNHYGRSTAQQRIDRAVVHQYEPGSTFKLVTMAAALERGRVSPYQRFDCQNGRLRLGSRLVRDDRSWGVLTASEIFHHSSNIGMIKIVSALDAAELHETLDGFGFGHATGVELPGELPGILRPPEQWGKTSWASLAFGHEVAVTVLQMASAFAAVANDGVWIAPRVTLGRVDTSGRFTPFPRPPARRAISAATARELTAMMEGVVGDGTGRRAAIDGYRVAGKTGTAQKIVDGAYSTDIHVASFGGFAPAGAPRIAGLVVLDAPRGFEQHGGQVAAPAFARIVADTLAYLRVPPDEPPRFARADAEPPEGARAAVLRRSPSDGSTRGDRATAPAAIADGGEVVPAGGIPDLTGLPARKAVARLAEAGWGARIEGHGVVLAQIPAAGAALAAGDSCRLLLGPPPPPDEMLP